MSDGVRLGRGRNDRIHAQISPTAVGGADATRSRRLAAHTIGMSDIRAPMALSRHGSWTGGGGRFLGRGAR